MARRIRLAARYGTLEKSPEQSGMSLRQRLFIGGLIAIGITGCLVWIGGLSLEREGDAYRIVRRHHARPAASAPSEPATTRADGRLVG